MAMYFYLRLGSNRQIESLYELKEGLNAGTSLNGAEFELGEHACRVEISGSSGVLIKHRRRLR